MKLRITDVPNLETTKNFHGLYATRNHFPLIARILMSSIFIWSGISKIMNPLTSRGDNRFKKNR